MKMYICDETASCDETAASLAKNTLNNQLYILAARVVNIWEYGRFLDTEH